MAAPNNPAVGALLADDVASLEERWAELSEEALLEEITRYRDAIKSLASDINRLGAVLSSGADNATASTAPATEDDPDPQGIEGVDYRVGSVEDIHPSEWQFDVIMMDPPWQLATANPTRGVALGYSQLTDRDIQNLPIPKLQSNGFLFIWVINAKFQFTLDLFERWGYDLVDEIVWVKMTVNRRLAKSHGFYLQHAKEVCLVGKKGLDPPGMKGGVASDVIYSERRGQSQKPEEIYQLIEELVPNGRYLEIFGRKNNLRDFWVTVGNEVTGQGPPKENDGNCQPSEPHNS